MSRKGKRKQLGNKREVFPSHRSKNLAKAKFNYLFRVDLHYGAKNIYLKNNEMLFWYFCLKILDILVKILQVERNVNNFAQHLSFIVCL